MDSRRPVEDWAIDFDHFDPQWTSNPYPVWDDLRSRCPVATSQRFEDGAYFPTRYDDVRAICRALLDAKLGQRYRRVRHSAR